MGSHNRLKVLVCIDWYLPGYKAGGPIRSVSNLITRLNYEFSVITSDRDLFDTRPYENIEPNTWINGPNNERIMYLSPSEIKVKTFKRLISEDQYDRIYINSLFSPAFALRPLWAIQRLGLAHKTILAPRGMLKGGALSQKSAKKKFFLKFAGFLGLYKGLLWHATNRAEAYEIGQYFPGAEVKIASNMIKGKGIEFYPIVKNEGTLHLVTIARVSPEKNILGGIRFLDLLKDNPGKVEWKIYGALQNEEYLNECRNLASKMSHAQIDFMGEIEHSQLQMAFREAHFLYLPTLGENYGHAIAESFLHGRPVIISNKTPWKNLEAKNAGWNIPLEDEIFAKVLKQCLDLDDKNYQVYINGAKSFGKVLIAKKTDMAENYEMFSYERIK